MDVSEQTFFLAFDKAPFAATLSRLPTGVLVAVNEAFERTFGYTREEAVGKTTLELQINPDAEGRARITAELQARGSVRDLELALGTKSGERRVFMVHVDLVAIGGQRYILSTTQDITDRKRAEAERDRLLAAEREARALAEEALRMREEFLSVAAHELKTPIAGLVGSAQLIMRQFERGRPPDSAQLEERLAAISQQAGKLGRLVAQLLDVSRMEAGRLGLEPAETELVALVERVVAAVRAQARRHLLSLHAPEQAVAAWVDAMRIEQVVMNLLHNAVRFSPAGSRIDVSVGREDESGWVRLTVQDCGVGIPPEKRASLFERFYQAHGNDHRSGLGLGLYISHQIVELHGGRLSAEFPPEGGARFVVSLPPGTSPAEASHRGQA